MRQMRIAVIGTGYVGLVTGTCLAEAGHDVVCVDIDENKINNLKNGIIPIYEPGLTELVIKNRETGRLTFTTSLQELGEPEAIFFALPTPPGGDGNADLSYVMGAAKDVAKVIGSYTVLINKSTVPVGTAKKVAEVVAAETDIEFDVVSNPEFLREGFAVTDFMQSDRIVVGTSSDKAKLVMEELYRPFTATGVPLIVMDETSSEMTKYAANSFLATKISFMNEIANLCERVGANVDNVRLGIGADERIGRRFLYAGIGYGGSCFPKDVLALERSAEANDYQFKILKAVMEVNAIQKKVLVQKIIDVMGEDLHGKTFAMWGLAFKANTDDIREAPSLDIIQELTARGAVVQAYDPEAAENVKRIIGDAITYAPSAQEALAGANALLVVTEWEEFLSADLRQVGEQLSDKIVFDGRNIFDPAQIKGSGITYVSIGRGTVNNA
jgi:UDPglucose 6-dehydrogenase